MSTTWQQIRPDSWTAERWDEYLEEAGSYWAALDYGYDRLGGAPHNFKALPIARVTRTTWFRLLLARIW